MVSRIACRHTQEKGPAATETPRARGHEEGALMPVAQPIPNGPGRYKPAVAARLRCEPRQPRSVVPGIPDRALGRSLAAVFERLAQHRGRVCAGCPIVPGVPDRAIRYPTCEICRWPAVGVGPVHAWRCAFCRHWN